MGKEITGTAFSHIFLEKSGSCYPPSVGETQEVHACPAELFHNTVSQTAFIKHESTLFNSQYSTYANLRSLHNCQKLARNKVCNAEAWEQQH